MDGLAYRFGLIAGALDRGDQCCYVDLGLWLEGDDGLSLFVAGLGLAHAFDCAQCLVDTHFAVSAAHPAYGEFNLLALLIKEAGKVVSRERLAAEGLGRPLMASDRRIETHMAQVRRKLGPMDDGSPRIQTVRGAGYQYLVNG